VAEAKGKPARPRRTTISVNGESDNDLRAVAIVVKTHAMCCHYFCI